MTGTTPRYPVRRRIRDALPTPLTEFLATEAAGGIVLFAAAVVALVWINSPLSDSYHELWDRIFTIGSGSFAIHETLRDWVNDGLMAVFFFVVGLEIKRELVTGELRDPRKAALPALAAVGGMIAPALIYTAFNAGGPGARGWGTPMATDIAFAVGVLALLSSRVPRGLKLFLLTLAIVDDLGAILVIAVFYTESIHLTWLAGAAAMIATILALQQLGVRRPVMYVLPAVVMWVCMLESGVHATVAGVIVGVLTPAHPFRGRHIIEPLEHAFHPWSAFVILPIFALANAGVEISGSRLADAVSQQVTIGIFFGLLVGKTIGVSFASWLAVRLRLGRLPDGVRAAHVLGAGALAGIGFTVALFIAELSFDGPILDDAKLGILAASLVAGLVGSTILAVVGRRARAPEPEPEHPVPL